MNMVITIGIVKISVAPFGTNQILRRGMAEMVMEIIVAMVAVSAVIIDITRTLKQSRTKMMIIIIIVVAIVVVIVVVIARNFASTIVVVVVIIIVINIVMINITIAVIAVAMIMIAITNITMIAIAAMEIRITIATTIRIITNTNVKIEWKKVPEIFRILPNHKQPTNKGYFDFEKFQKHVLLPEKWQSCASPCQPCINIDGGTKRVTL